MRTGPDDPGIADNLSMFYTRKGDSGTTGLFGTNERLPKESPVYEALGTLDELNALLGICFATSRKRELRIIQQHLFIIQAELAGAHKCITAEHVRELEAIIDDLEAQMQRPRAFIGPRKHQHPPRVPGRLKTTERETHQH